MWQEIVMLVCCIVLMALGIAPLVRVIIDIVGEVIKDAKSETDTTNRKSAKRCKE